MRSMFLAIGSASGDIGQAISYILSTDSLDIPAVAFDKNPKRSRFFTKMYQSPASDSEEFILWFEEFVLANNISHYVPCSEYEMRAIPYYLDSLATIRTVWAGHEIFNLFDDKLAGSKFMHQHGLHVPPLIDPKIIDKDQFMPCVLKPRRNSGSRGIIFCITEKQLREAISGVSDFIIQEFIPYSDNEYTVGVFRDAKGETRTIILRRSLEKGRTKFATVVEDVAIANECRHLAEVLNLNGSINVQIRKQKGINYIFEVNPRFSSTVQGRHLLGFKDFLWSIGIGELPEQDEIDQKVGTSIIRDDEGIFHIYE